MTVRYWTYGSSVSELASSRSTSEGVRIGVPVAFGGLVDTLKVFLYKDLQAAPSREGLGGGDADLVGGGPLVG